MRKKLPWAQLMLSVFLFAACREQTVPLEAPSNKTAQEKADSLRQWRESRALARARAETERQHTPTQSQTNQIDPEKAKQALGSFSERLKNIVGDTPSDDEILKKAEQGDANAQADLAAKFVREGNFDAAFKWYSKAAEQGNVRAANALGVAHIFGQGTEVNYAEAVKWFKTAADQGDVNSQYSLGVRYTKGDHVEQNFTEAVKWFSKAANQGQPDSQVSLARRYANGEGVGKDVVEAYKWAWIADDYWSAVVYRQELEKNLTPEQIAEAKERAKVFKPITTISK